MRNQFFTFLAAILVLTAITISPAFAGSREVDCARCNVFHTAPDVGIKPASVPLVCLDFRQIVPEGMRTQRVVLFIYDKDGQYVRPPYPREKAAEDAFCVGRHWVEDARGGEILLCNKDGTATLDADFIADVLRRGGMPKGALMCLVPGGVCN